MYQKVTFKYYSNPNSTGKIALKLRMTINGRRYELYPNIVLEPDQWNQKAQKVKGRSDSYQINDALDNFKRVCQEVQDRLRDNVGEFSPTQLKQAVSAKWIDGEDSTESGVPKRFWEFLDYFIGFKERTGKNQKHTIGEYKRVKDLLKGFNRSLDWADLNDEFYHSFCVYCEEQGHSLPYIGKHITAIKACINKAKEESIEAAMKVRTRNWKAFNEIKRTPTLSLQELQALYDLDLSNNPTLDKVRNIFYLACWTGMRPSDFTKLSNASIEGENILVRPRKTNKNATNKHDLILPISTPIRRLLDRVGGIPESFTEQHLNRHLPTLGEMIGMTQPLTLNKSNLKGDVIQYQEPRFKHLKCRCARKTFATLHDELGLSRQEAMGITGHTTEKAFNHYVMTDKIHNAEATRRKINALFVDENSTPQ